MSEFHYQKLNEKQRKFCEEYVKDNNGSRAAVRAGYTENSSRVTASKLLTNANIKAYIDELKAELKERCMVESHVVLNMLKQEATNFDNPGSTRVQAQIALGKCIGLFTDKVEHSGDVVPNVIKRVAVYRTEDGRLVEADKVSDGDKIVKHH